MKKVSVRLLCKAAAFSALVFLFTAYLHIPAGNGYIHVGDGLIFLAACLLPRPYAIGVGVCGALLADCLTGYALWAPASVVIKGLTVLFFSGKGKTILTLRNLCALVPAAILCAGGYYLYEALFYGNWVSPLAYIPSNLIQSAAGAVLFVAAGFTMDRTKTKSRLFGA